VSKAELNSFGQTIAGENEGVGVEVGGRWEENAELKKMFVTCKRAISGFSGSKSINITDRIDAAASLSHSPGSAAASTPKKGGMVEIKLFERVPISNRPRNLPSHHPTHSPHLFD
jgi:hypothetical protein